MSKLIRRSLLLLVVGMLSGCSSGVGAKPAATQAMPANVFVMQSNGINVLKLTAAPDIKCAIKDGSLHFTAAQYEVECWLVKGAQSIDDAIPHVDSQIIDEFKDFKAEHITDLTIAGSPAKQLIGSGHEADDGDPGDADIIVFKVGANVFVACNHGESLTPTGQQGLSTLVQTAQMP